MIPTYNQSEFIEDAVRSALQQSYDNLEVIVGDDASTDNTEEIVGAIDDPRLRYVRHQKNLGRVGNYRKLLYEFVSGDYVVNLDGDDYYTDANFISAAVDLIVNAESAPLMIVARASRGGSESASDIPALESIDGLELLNRLPRQEYALMHMAIVYRVDDAKKCDFYRSTAISSDWESLYRLAALGTVVYLDRNIGVWRQHGGNQTASVDLDMALQNLGIWRSIYSHAAAHGMNSRLAARKTNQCVAHYALRFLVETSKQGNATLVHSLVRFAAAYPMGFIFLIFSLTSVKRLARSFLGFDRKHSLTV